MIKTLIVDDEVHAQQLLAHLLETYGGDKFELVGSCGSVDEAIPVIKKKKPDLVFLDVQMPGKTGFELFDTFTDPEFSVIFTTAYKEYAYNAIKVRPFDYLVKPINSKEFAACLDKFYDFCPPKQEVKIRNEHILHVAMENQIHFIHTHEILYLKADGSYTEIHRENKDPLMVSKNLKSLSERLSSKDFVRIHAKFVVNINKIVSWDKQEHYLKLVSGEEISVAYRRATDLTRLLEG
ncbi:MAG: LytR/AlgR family response regulator transcription factor [Nitritalea sp.]